MPDFTHARVCIRHGSGSVEIQAPAGEVTWLDLSGLHALPVASGNGGRRKRRLLVTSAFLVCSSAVGVGLGVIASGRSIPPGVRAEAATLERSAAQQGVLPDLTMPSTVQVPRGMPATAPEPTPQPAAPGADPFGLRR